MAFQLIVACPASATDVDVAVVFAVDRSLSLNKEERIIVAEGHASALESPQVFTAIRRGRVGCIAVAYFEWSAVGDSRDVLPWTRICDRSDAASAAAIIRKQASLMVGRSSMQGWTSISFALRWGAALLDKIPYHADRKVIDLCAEDRNNQGETVETARQAVLDKAYVINAIALTDSNASDTERASMIDYLRTHVIGGENSFVMETSDPAAFHQALRRKLVIEIGLLDHPTGGLTGSNLAPAERLAPPDG